jgi:hypothetical protein
MQINRRQRIVLMVGGGVLAVIWGFTFTLRATTWLDRPPIACKLFPTKDLAYPTGKVRVCLSEIVRPWDEMSEDADYQISLYNPTAKVRADLQMRISIPIERRKLSILWRVEKVQVYDNRGVQVAESTLRYTSSHPRFMPADITFPVWWWLVGMARIYPSPKPDYETIVDGVVERTSRTVATVTAAGLTIWRFIQASSEEPG